MIIHTKMDAMIFHIPWRNANVLGWLDLDTEEKSAYLLWASFTLLLTIPGHNGQNI